MKFLRFLEGLRTPFFDTVFSLITRLGEETIFLVLAILNSFALIPVALSGALKGPSKFLMVTALAAIGLGTSLTDFKKAGLRPMFYGITIDTLVTITALVVVWGMGLM